MSRDKAHGGERCRCAQPLDGAARHDRACREEGETTGEYVAANGQEITKGMVDRWCDAYERGEFPEGERTVGDAVYGRPPLSTEGTAVISIKMPIGMKRAVERRAKSEGISTSAFARAALADRLLGSGAQGQ